MFAGTCFVYQKIKYLAVDSELTEKLFRALIVFEVHIWCSQLLQDGLVRQHSHGLHRNSTRDGSYQSTPDEQLSVSVGGLMSGRAPSESDLSSNISDDVLVTPGSKLNGLHIQTSGSLVSTDEVPDLTPVIGASEYVSKSLNSFFLRFLATSQTGWGGKNQYSDLLWTGWSGN